MAPPADADVSSMPEHALRTVAVDHCVPVAQMAGLLVRLSQQEVAPPQTPNSMNQADHNKAEVAIAAESSQAALEFFKSGKLTPYTCPECSGVLAQFQDGNRPRFRCHTGHAFSADALLAAVTEHVEAGFYKAIRSVDESVMLLNHLGDHFAEANEPKLAAVYFKKAKEAQTRAGLVRRALQTHEQLNKELMEKEVGSEEPGGEGG